MLTYYARAQRLMSCRCCYSISIDDFSCGLRVIICCGCAHLQWCGRRSCSHACDLAGMQLLHGCPTSEADFSR